MRYILPAILVLSALPAFAFCQKTHLFRTRDTLFFPPAIDSITLLRPVYGDFEQLDSLIRLCYVRDTVFRGKFLHAGVLGVGTHFFSTGSPEADTICSGIPVFEKFNGVIQVTVRRDTSFIGYCEELLGLPFVLPPRIIPGFGHQTDLRLATDCAAVAVYARRRQGFKIPYAGPRGLWKYLEKAEQLVPGTILHYGHQVSILYEDRGTPGVLDDDDLLLHAYRQKVEIARLGKTDLKNQRYRAMQWKQ